MIWGTFATSKHKIINALYISRRLNLVIQKQNERISTLTDIFLEKNILLALGFKPSTRHRMSSCLAIPFSCRDLHLYIVESTIDYFALISCPRVIILKTRHKVCQIASNIIGVEKCPLGVIFHPWGFEPLVHVWIWIQHIFSVQLATFANPDPKCFLLRM